MVTTWTADVQLIHRLLNTSIIKSVTQTNPRTLAIIITDLRVENAIFDQVGRFTHELREIETETAILALQPLPAVENL